jgi:hypothetical protein
MINKAFPFLCRQVAESDLADAGGAAAPAAVAEATAAEEAPAPAAPVAKLSILERAHAAVANKQDLLAGARAAEERAAGAEVALAATAAELAELRARLDVLETERAELDTVLSATRAEVSTVEGAAATQVAALGFEAAALPHAEAKAESLEEALAELAACTDPQAKAVMARKVRALRSAR